MSLYRLSLEHSAGILILCDQGLVRTAMSLLRLQLEAYVRAEWFHFRASENDIARFLKHSDPPKFGEMISALEEHPPFDKNHLSRTKVDFWKIFNDFTHGGALQVDAMADANTSEALLDESIIGESLEASSTMALLAALGIVRTVGDQSLAEELRVEFDKTFQ